MREVDEYFREAWAASQPSAEARLSWYYWRLPQRGPNGRCEVLRRYLAAASGNGAYAELSDGSILDAAKSLGIPI